MITIGTIGPTIAITIQSTKTITIGTPMSSAIGVIIGERNISRTEIGTARQRNSDEPIGTGATSAGNTTIATTAGSLSIMREMLDRHVPVAKGG
jgi:hypothetical protein